MYNTVCVDSHWNSLETLFAIVNNEKTNSSPKNTAQKLKFEQHELYIKKYDRHEQLAPIDSE